MRTLVIGDIHGGAKALTQILSATGIESGDTLIFLGDYVDGWSETPQVIDLLIQLQQTHNCIFIRGNHDQLFLEWLSGKDNQPNTEMWYAHGGEATVKAYTDVSETVKAAHLEFLKSLLNYHLDDQNRLFVHAGFTNLHGVKYEYFPKMFYWERTLWETAMALDKNMKKDHPQFPRRLNLYKEIYIGHTPVTRIGKTTPIRMDCVWNVDTGAGFMGPLTAMDIDSKEYWQSDPLPSLYPNETGRN